jgi:hypothetical protein
MPLKVPSLKCKSRSLGGSAVSSALREGFPPQVTGEPVRVDGFPGIKEPVLG